MSHPIIFQEIERGTCGISHWTPWSKVYQNPEIPLAEMQLESNVESAQTVPLKNLPDSLRGAGWFGQGDLSTCGDRVFKLPPDLEGPLEQGAHRDCRYTLTSSNAARM